MQINIKAISICGSDVHGYDGSSGRRILPIICGHEASGMISAVGISATVLSAVEYLRKRGNLTLVGNVTPKVGIPLQTIVFKELELVGRCYTYNGYDMKRF